MTNHERKLGAALWAALDVVRDHIGGFDKWPLTLKQAFAEAIIDDSPPTEADIARTHELAARYGWEDVVAVELDHLRQKRERGTSGDEASDVASSTK